MHKGNLDHTGHCSNGGFDFMRSIGDKKTLCMKYTLKPFQKLVEGSCQFAQFVLVVTLIKLPLEMGVVGEQA